MLGWLWNSNDGEPKKKQRQVVEKPLEKRVDPLSTYFKDIKYQPPQPISQVVGSPNTANPQNPAGTAGFSGSSFPYSQPGTAGGGFTTHPPPAPHQLPFGTSPPLPFGTTRPVGPYGQTTNTFGAPNTAGFGGTLAGHGLQKTPLNASTMTLCVTPGDLTRKSPKNKERKKISDAADKLYKRLNITEKIFQWSETIRFWVAEHIVKKKIEEWNKNDTQITGVIMVLAKNYESNMQLKARFDKLLKETPKEQAQFLKDNIQLLPAEWKEFVEKRKRLKEQLRIQHSSKADRPDPVYCLSRLKDLSQNAFLGNFNFSAGEKWQGHPWGPPLPTDAKLVMTYFCHWMDDLLGPAVIFSESHFIKLKHYKERVVEGKHRFDTVAIVETTIPVLERESKEPQFGLARPLEKQRKKVEPYYFLVYKDQKKDASKKEEIEDHSTKFWGRRNKVEGTLYPAWYPRPGPDNIFHCLALFNKYFSMKITF